MNPSPIHPASWPAAFDMHIGSTFDAEKYLELERKLFKIEPRPVPRPGRSEASTPAEKSILDGFIHKATKFACWLDDVLKAPFQAFSSKSTSPTSAGSESVREMPEAKQSQEITPPPRVYNTKTTESRRDPDREALPNVAGGIVLEQAEKFGLTEPSQKKFGVIKHGHVKGLIKKYEDWSDMTREGSIKHSNNKAMASEVPWIATGQSGMEDSFFDGTTEHVKANQPTQKGVTKPAKAASTSSMMKKHNASPRDGKSGVRVTSCEDENASDVGDTDNRPSRGCKNRVQVENVGNARRAGFPKFRRMRRGSNKRSPLTAQCFTQPHISGKEGMS